MQKNGFINKYLIWIVPLFIAVVLFLLWEFRPQAERKFKPPVSRINVEVKKLELETITAQIRSYGVVEPRVRSRVVAQVTGRVVFVAEQFRDGSFFKRGDKLLELDKADYEIEVEIAKANLAEAERALQEQIGLAQQAKGDWRRLGNKGEPPPLVARVPQMKAAEAGVSSAKARLRLAELNLSRCDIIAPFDGRVLTNSVDLGQVVGSNAVLAEIYATDAIEIRLPIKNSELALLHLPESGHQPDHQSDTELPDVEIYSELAGSEIWQGKVVRTSGSIDETTRQLYVVARIDDPFGEKIQGRFPLKIGQYVTATIKGKEIENVLVVPNRAIYQGIFVYALEGEAVYRREVDIFWQSEKFALVKAGLSAGETLVLTPLGQVSSGTLVRVKEGAEQELELADRRRKGNAEKPEASPSGNNNESR